MAQPVITSFSPTSGSVGTFVKILGSNFNTIAANNIVYFGATKATVSSVSLSSLTVIVPSGATYEPISITSNGLTVYLSKPFLFLPLLVTWHFFFKLLGYSCNYKVIFLP